MGSAGPAWQQLVFTTSADLAERLSDALMSLGAVSVDATDALAGTPDEEPQYGEPGMAPKAWTVSLIKALFAPEADARAALAEACATLGVALPEAAVEAVPEQDWVRLTQAQFSPIHVSPRLWIVPSWCEPPADGAEQLVLDPGLAFGTGSHPTTRLCLQWIDAHLRRGASVLDYGCGSGILALAAQRFGAAAVLGIDIDAQAVASSRFNAATNGCPGADSSAIDDSARADGAAPAPGAGPVRFELPDADPGGRFELVVANILSNPLMLMAAMLCARVAPGGDLVLSGVLERQADEVIAAYRPWVALQVWRSDEGWVCLHGRASG
ncbi:MAG: 50S ribosomal protein L11 methyltransferase [Rhodocyclaceae bacterium]|nr:50S ribosomal protein L11 methyltransferase [Rhodocyclaceae bacterium]